MLEYHPELSTDAAKMLLVGRARLAAWPSGPHRFAFDFDVAAIGPFERHQQSQQRRFSRAAGANDGDLFTRVDVDIQPP